MNERCQAHLHHRTSNLLVTRPESRPHSTAWIPCEIAPCWVFLKTIFQHCINIERYLDGQEGNSERLFWWLLGAEMSVMVLQSSAEQIAKVAADKQATGEPITHDDAARIHSAEVQKTGGAIPGGLAAQAQSAASQAEKAGLHKK